MKNRSLTLLMTASLGLASVPGALAQSTPAPAPVTAPAQRPPAAAPATSSSQAADTRLAAANVSLEIGTYSGPLSSLLAAVAKSAGYDVIFDTDVDGLSGASSAGATAATPAGTAGGSASGTAAPAPTGSRPVVYNFRNTPFNQVWPLLMDIYGLSYEVVQVGPTQVLRISANPIQRVIALKNANAVDAVNQVKLFFGTPTYNETPVKDAQGNVTGVTRTLSDVKIDSPTLRIVADSRTNSLIVRGTNREVADVQRLAAQLDQQLATAAGSTGADSSQTVQRVYAVKGQQADIVALLAAQYPNLKVTAVGQTGQLVITGAQNQLDAALNLLAGVDKPTPVITVNGPVTVQKVFQLTNASADDVKTVLQGTLQRDLGTGTGLVGNATPIIQADGTTVIQPPASAQTPATQTGAAGTQASSAAAAQANVPQATIISDKRTNTLIIRGTQAQVDQIAQIIPSLDVKVPQVNLQVRIQEINETASRALGVDWKAGFGNFVVNVASTAVNAIFDPTRALVGFNLGATLTAIENQGMTKRVYDGAVTMQSGQRSLGSGSDTQNASSGAAAHVQSGGRIELNIPSPGANVPPIQKQIDYGVTLDFFNPQVAPDGTITVRVAGKVAGQPDSLTNINLINYTNSEAQTTITFKAGETVLLSGLLGTNEASTTAGIPFLSSIPIIGSLFGKQTTNSTRSQLLVVITGNVLQ
jgi:type IV pilus assembly protein PilQ